MDRRGFFGSIAVILPIPCLVKQRSQPESEFGLGKYVRHLTTAHYRDNGIEEGYSRYIMFPVDVVLTVEYEKGNEEYFSFNTKTEDISRINQMSGEELLSHKKSMNESEKSYGGIPLIFDRNIVFRLSCIHTNQGLGIDRSLLT
jgi:hypothetical protein